jgi:hypothetical protein
MDTVLNTYAVWVTNGKVGYFASERKQFATDQQAKEYFAHVVFAYTNKVETASVVRKEK